MNVTTSKNQRGLKRQLLMMVADLEPRDLVRVTGLSSVRVSLAIHGHDQLPAEAASKVASLMRRRIRKLFEEPGDGDR